MRDSLGNAVGMVGAFVSRASRVLAILCGLAVLVGLGYVLFGDTGNLSAPFSGEPEGAWAYLWQAAVIGVAVLVVGQILAVGISLLGYRIISPATRERMADYAGMTDAELDDEISRRRA